MLKRTLHWGILVSLLLIGALHCGPSSDGNLSTTPQWTFVDGNGDAGINKSSSQSATYPDLATFQGRLYATWSESSGSYNQIRVAIFNNNEAAPTWTFVDGGQIWGINRDSQRSASVPKLVDWNGTLVITWIEFSTFGVQQVRVAAFNGNESSPVWTRIDGNEDWGLNYNRQVDASNSRLTVFNNKLYLAWSEVTAGAQHIRVSVFNSNLGAPAWTAVDAHGTEGLARDHSQISAQPQLIVLNSKLLCIWTETYQGHYKIRVSYYNGLDSNPTWTDVDTSIQAGLNFGAGNDAFSPNFIVHKGHLYGSWSETNNVDATQVRVIKLVGTEQSPSWKWLDTGGYLGINFDTSKNATNPKLISHRDRLYATWQQANGFASQVRVALFNDSLGNPKWDFVDGGNTFGLNKNSAVGASNPTAQVFENKLYLSWQEANSAAKTQIRVILGK